MGRSTDVLFLFFVLSGTIVLASCRNPLASSSEISCSSPNAIDVTTSLIKQQVEKNALAKAKTTDGSFIAAPSSIRSAIGLLKIGIDDIRTTKTDPNSTKKSCAATAKVVFPIYTLNDADTARAMSGLNKVEDLGEAAGVQRSADYFTFPINYNVQPTDDGKAIFADSDSIEVQMDFLAEVVNSSLLKAKMQNEQITQQQAMQTAEQQQRVATQQASQANQDQAKAENDLSIQTINAAWHAIDPTTRGQLLDVQRAWIKAKAANCNIQAAAASTDSIEKETARLKCDTSADQSRTEWLKQYLPRADGQ